jgi:hypothetical protein
MSLTNESRLCYICSVRTPWKTSPLPSNGLFLSHPLKRTGVYRMLHSKEHITDPQKTLYLFLCSLQRVYCVVCLAKESVRHNILEKPPDNSPPVDQEYTVSAIKLKFCDFTFRSAEAASLAAGSNIFFLTRNIRQKSVVAVT